MKNTDFGATADCIVSFWNDGIHLRPVVIQYVKLYVLEELTLYYQHAISLQFEILWK